ncbi:YceI family protein [Arenimonas sp.]|uniref:YceI family protein n=1 Tax=Arenimonas sp. TaxID=1872635 RepID=UPI0035AED360
MKRLHALLLILSLLAAPLALAADWQAAKGSTLGFRASYMDEAFEGRFARFSPAIRFDPDALEDARFDVRIELATADTDSPDRDEMLVGPDFFDARRAPEARYVATSFRHLGGNDYEAKGELTLNGVTRPVPLRFTWTPGTPATLEGKATVRRLAFGVGEGDWADTGLLPDEVEVFTRLVLQPRT